MPRLAANAIGGYYPAHPDAVAAMLRYLRPPADGGGFFLLDPCAGEGAAVAQLAEGLGCRQQDILAIELDELRAEQLKGRLPEAPVLAPASFFGTFCTSQSADAAWVNPPYADIGGEGRVEFSFLERVTGWLRTKGILMWVVPESVIEKHEHRQFLLAHYHNLVAVTFPKKHRRFHELVVFGVKRGKPIEPSGRWAEFDERCRLLDGDHPPPPDFYYTIPSGIGPATWAKTEPVESELLAALQKSPLNKILESAPEMPLASPPMSLGKGHIAMLLAAGQLDGIVRHPGEPPHLIRGVAKKEKYLASAHTEEDKNQRVTKTVMSEKIVVTIRALVPSGRIIELTQKGAAA